MEGRDRPSDEARGLYDMPDPARLRRERRERDLREIEAARQKLKQAPDMLPETQRGPIPIEQRSTAPGYESIIDKSLRDDNEAAAVADHEASVSESDRAEANKADWDAFQAEGGFEAHRRPDSLESEDAEA